MGSFGRGRGHAGTSVGSAGKSSTPPPASRLSFWRLHFTSMSSIRFQRPAISLPANEGAVFCEHSPWCSESPVWQVQFVYLWQASEILCRSGPVGVRYHSGSMLYQWLHSCSSFFSSVATKSFYVERAICHQPHGERLEIWGARHGDGSPSLFPYQGWLLDCLLGAFEPRPSVWRRPFTPPTWSSCPCSSSSAIPARCLPTISWQRRSYPESDRLNSSATELPCSQRICHPWYCACCRPYHVFRFYSWNGVAKVPEIFQRSWKKSPVSQLHQCLKIPLLNYESALSNHNHRPFRPLCPLED